MRFNNYIKTKVYRGKELSDLLFSVNLILDDYDFSFQKLWYHFTH